MFGVGISELVLIGIIALIVIGPDELPKIARVLGRLINELKGVTDGLKKEFLSPLDDVKKTTSHSSHQPGEHDPHVPSSNLNPNSNNNEKNNGESKND